MTEARIEQARTLRELTHRTATEIDAGLAAGKINWQNVFKLLIQILPLIAPFFLTEEPTPPKPE